MITRVSSLEELKLIFVEIMLNKTNKITKIANQSIVNGVAYGAAKVGQKALKEVALVETRLFPDFAFGSHLDGVADQLGIAARYGSSESSTYVRLVANPGTTYTAGTHVFEGGGESFDLVSNITVGVSGFAYAKIRSQNKGKKTNVAGLVINTVAPIPAGHSYVINEYKAEGGRDAEDDNLFRIRIKEGSNIAATGTLAKVTQAFIKINPNVLKVYFQGTNNASQPILAIATQNGIDLTTPELDALQNGAAEVFSLLDLNVLNNNTVNLELKNIEYQPIDVDFRVELIGSTVADNVRIDVQIAFSKLLDWREWKTGRNVEWDDLLGIVKDHPDVKYVPDAFFIPGADIPVDPNKLPRIRGFIMRDMNGDIIVNQTGTLSPVFYPTDVNETFQATVL